MHLESIGSDRMDQRTDQQMENERPPRGRRRGLRLPSSWIATIVVAGLALPAVTTDAATRSMTGALGVVNPSTQSPYLFESGPAVFGRKIGPYAPTAGFETVSVTGATGSTSVGRQVTIGAGQFDFVGSRTRDFPAFAGVANTTRTFQSGHPAATFMIGEGALAACPGPGCTSSGAGTQISWCPPVIQPTATPAPGTVSNPIGDWSCPSYPAGAGGGNRGHWIRISNADGPSASHFGGTFSLLRNGLVNTWRVLVQPGTQGTAAEVTRTFKIFAGLPWPGGRPNFAYASDVSNNGPRVLASLDANGAVSQTFGCVNPTGTVGAPFDPGNPLSVAGSNCGTNPVTPPPIQNWGFKMTTGTISGSDFYPFLDATTALGTPLAPNFQPGAYGDGFFFTRMGTDTVSGSTRNLVLLGGGVSYTQNGANAFFRITDLRMRMTVPEPAMGLGIVVGGAALAGLARRRGLA